MHAVLQLLCFLVAPFVLCFPVSFVNITKQRDMREIPSRLTVNL